MGAGLDTVVNSLSFSMGISRAIRRCRIACVPIRR